MFRKKRNHFTYESEQEMRQEILSLEKQLEQEKQKVRDLEIQKEICEKQLVFICSQIDINKAFTETLKNINEQLLSIKKENK